MVHLTQFFDDSLCGLKNLDKRELTYSMNKVTCSNCLEASRKEAIECQQALDTLPNCPHCGEHAAQVTLTFNVTKVYRLDVSMERDFETKTIKPLIYGSESDTLGTDLIFDKEWQVSCENGHEWFTKRLDPIENGEQWFVKEGVVDEEIRDNICPVCGNDRSEHNWEVHTAEMKAGY